MSNRVFKEKIVELLDGEEITVRPLPLKSLRKFMTKFDELKDMEGDVEGLSKMAEMAAIAVGHFDDRYATVDKIEEVIDTQTMYEVFKIAAGVDLDPESERNQKMMERAMERLGDSS